MLFRHLDCLSSCPTPFLEVIRVSGDVVMMLLVQCSQADEQPGGIAILTCLLRKKNKPKNSNQNLQNEEDANAPAANKGRDTDKAVRQQKA